MDIRRFVKGPIKFDFVVTLLILFSIFVLGDIITTTWLIHNDPAGISNEGNPFGVLLYLKYGVFGLFLGKMFFFLPFSLMVLLYESKYKKIKWFHQTTEIIVLGLIAYSLVVVLNNVTAIIVLQWLKGRSFLLQLLSTMRIFIVVFALSIEVVILNLFGFKSWLRRVETIVGSSLIIIPLLAYESLYIFLAENPLFFAAYLASMMTILGIAFYLIDEIIKEQRMHKKQQHKKNI